MEQKHILIPVFGRKLKASLTPVDISELLFDEFNPRISLARDTHMGAIYKDHFPQDHVALTLKGTPSYHELKISILKGGGAMNPLWVYPEKDKYVVIEGNTRLAVYRDILKEEPNNQPFTKVNCYVLPQKIEEDVKNFIRVTAHLHGQEDWDKYEQAKYLYVLYEKQNYPISALADMTKLKSSDIEGDIEAYKIMEQQFYPKYGKFDKSFVHKFSYFKEYVKDKKLRNLMATLNLDSKQFCDWVGKGKFDRAMDVRKLYDVLSDKATRKVFVNKDLGLALEELGNIKPEKSSKVFKLIDALTTALGGMKMAEIDEIKGDKKKVAMVKALSKKLSNLAK